MTDPIRAAETLAASCRSLLEEVARMGDCIGKHTVGEITAISDRVAAWLRENPLGQVAQPAPPAEGEVGEVVKWLRENAEDERQMCESVNRASLNLDRAADLLEQRHPTPVPVSERLPGPEDCDAEGRCWWGAPALSGTVTGSVPHSWRLCRPEDRFGSELVWLPAAALPLPAGELQP